MILSAVNICYDPLHQPFATEGAVKIQNLNSERPASKIIRAVLRDSDIDPEDAVHYSIHRCYCNFKIKIEDDDEDESFNPESTLDELEIKDADSVFIRKIDVGEAEEEEQGSTLRRSSRERKERADDESLHSQLQRTSEMVTLDSTKRGFTSDPSNRPATVDEVSSNLENLPSSAAQVARTISKLLGGEGWKSQSIGKLGPIQTRGHSQLAGLVRLVKTSLEIEQISEEEPGFFNSDLVEALTRAYHQRTSHCSKKSHDNHFWELGLSDYGQANELLKGKIGDDGSWEKSSLSHLDKSSLSTPASRYLLSDSGLSGKHLSTARDVSTFWNNDKWINQAPLPGLSPISLKKPSTNAILRQIAQLTRVKAGEASPDGFPPIVLKAVRESIRKNQEFFKSNPGAAAPFGWSQNRCLNDALVLLKERIGGTKEGSAPMTSDFAESSGSRVTEGRNVRRRL